MDRCVCLIRPQVLVILGLLAPQCLGFSWGGGGAQKGAYIMNPARPSVNLGSVDDLTIPHRPPQFYSEAVHELEALKSKEVCHRVAAVLLMDNCHLLKGKDEAAVFTDSGVQIRDFIESYAASLAICDLDRTGFEVPSSCTSFTESSLTPLLQKGEYGLHVSTKQIKSCLGDLFKTDAAWATWLSYRDKALQFCQASRADQEKTQNIIVYQKLIKVMSQLVQGVESDIQRHMDDLDRKAREAGEAIDKINPKIDTLRHRLSQMGDLLSGQLQHALENSAGSASRGLKDATQLQELLARTLAMVTERTSQAQAAHQAHANSLDHVSAVAQQASDDMRFFVTAISTAVSFTASLQQELEISRMHAESLANRQDTVEDGLLRLFYLTENISSNFDAHTDRLNSAHNLTADLVGNLEDAAAAASTVKASFSSWTALASLSFWLINFVWLTAFLVLGNYRLPPSGTRNLVLLSLAEALFFLVAYWDTCTETVLSRYSASFSFSPPLSPSFIFSSLMNSVVANVPATSI